MADFNVEPSSYFSSANTPRTITVKPIKANTGDTITRKLKIEAPGYDPKYITLTHRGAPSTTP